MKMFKSNSSGSQISRFGFINIDPSRSPTSSSSSSLSNPVLTTQQSTIIENLNSLTTSFNDTFSNNSNPLSNGLSKCILNDSSIYQDNNNGSSSIVIKNGQNSSRSIANNKNIDEKNKNSSGNNILISKRTHQGNNNNRQSNNFQSNSSCAGYNPTNNNDSDDRLNTIQYIPASYSSDFGCISVDRRGGSRVASSLSSSTLPTSKELQFFTINANNRPVIGSLSKHYNYQQQQQLHKQTINSNFEKNSNKISSSSSLISSLNDQKHSQQQQQRLQPKQMTSGQICVDKLIENIETQPKSTLNIFTQQRQNYRPWNKDNIKFVNNRMITGQQQLNETLNKDSFGFQQQQKDIHHHSNLPILFKSSSSSSSTLLNVNENRNNTNNREKFSSNHQHRQTQFLSTNTINTTKQMVDDGIDDDHDHDNNLQQQQSNNSEKLTVMDNINDKILLIKSQSLKFEPTNNQQQTDQPINQNLSFKNIRTKLESSKSLDMVDDQKLYSTNSSNDNNNNNNSSRLPRSLTSSCKRLSSSMKICGEPFFDVTNDPKTMMAHHDNHQQNQNNKTIETNISRSSTASLSLISNMNDAILNDISDNDDDDYNDSILDLRGRLLTAIDESSLSPLASFNSIITTDHNNQSNNDNNNSSMNIGVENNDDNIVIMMTDEKSVEPDDNMIFEQSSLENIQQLQPESEIMDEESALSLNSIELIQETNSDSLNCVEEKIDATKIEPKNVAKSLNKRTANDDKCIFKSNKSTKSSVMNRINNTANKHPISASTKTTTSTTKTLLNASTALIKAQVNQNRLISKKSGIATTRNIDYLNRKNLSSNNSSKPCSTNVSRCTTPALSETDSVCSLSTFTTNSTKSKRSTKMITNSAQNVNKRPYSSSTKDIHSTNSKNYYSHQKNGNDSNVGGLKKSTTYTRLAQTSSSSTSTKSAVVATRKENVNPINNDMAVTGTGKNSHSFAKPTTSYLRKAANNAPRQSPSGLSNINNANSVVTKTTNKPIGSVSGGGSGPSSTFTAKRSPTITLLNSLALSNKSTSNSANSSRRSSIASPTKPPVNLNSSKKDILQQLQYYENLSYERLQLIEKKKLELKQLSSKTNGFLTLFSFLLAEYRPFDTPKLRAELLTANQKCSNLNRDYELAKEISHQKQAEINLLMTNVGELTNVIEEHKEKIASIENQYNELKQEAESFDDERKRLENELHEAQSECANGKGIIADLEKRLDKAEGLLRTDRKYRELKEKVSNYEKEVDSLNVVVDMKTQRIRYLESEKMRTELELVDYEQLKESYQQLQRENEALTEALGMKARKNAEQSRELDILRTELKRETNERKRLAARYDTLEFQLNESRDMLSNISNMNNILNEESIKNAQSDEAGFFTPGQTTNSNFVESSRKSRPGSNSNAFRQLFSTPMMSDSQFKSRYHFQHQDPASDTSHRLPEVVLSSMNSSNCRSFHNKRNTTTTETNAATNVNVINGHQSSSSSPQSSFHPPTKLNTQTHHTDHHHHHQHNHHHQDIDPISTDSSLASSNSEERESRFSNDPTNNDIPLFL